MADKPQVVAIDINDLTLGEAADFEEASGISMQEVIALKKARKPYPVKALIAMVWIAKRREDESFTLEQARNLKVSEFAPPARPTKGKS